MQEKGFKCQIIFDIIGVKERDLKWKKIIFQLKE